MENIVEAVRQIQSIDRDTLNHTLKNLLINIVMHFCSCSDTQLSNEFLGREINESADYIKNLISKLKRKKYLKIDGRGRSRKILPGENLFRDCQSLIGIFGYYQSRSVDDVRDPQSPTDDVRDSQSPKNEKNDHAPINSRRNKERRNVVVSLAKKYGYDIDENLADMLNGIGENRLKNLLEYTKKKNPENPNGFLVRAIKSNWKIPDCSEKKNNTDPYAADRARLARAMAETTAAQNLGFKAAG